MSNCEEKVKTDECVQTRDDGYRECNKWADEGSNQCSAWASRNCHWYSPWNCIAGWFCQAFYWIANVVCKGTRWVENLVCVAWKYITKSICVLIDVVSSFINLIVAGLEIIITFVLGALGFILDLLLALPYIGRALEWILNVSKDIFNFVLSIPDSILTLIGIMPEKKLRLMVIIQKDESGNLTVKNLEVVYRDIQYLINTYRTELNVRVVPLNVLMLRTAFTNDTNLLSDFVKIDEEKSDSSTLDVCCDSCAAGDDLSDTGTAFKLKMAKTGFATNGRRLLSYGVPIIAFSVRRFTDGKLGCSLGSLSDYVTVLFNETDNGNKPEPNENERFSYEELTPDKRLDAVTDLAHEVSHCCNLPHLSTDNNIMRPSPLRGGNLTVWQKILVRSSRHVTYF